MTRGPVQGIRRMVSIRTWRPVCAPILCGVEMHSRYMTLSRVQPLSSCAEGRTHAHSESVSSLIHGGNSPATGGIEQRFNGGNIRDEHTSKDSNREGTLSMANTGQRHTAGSQFFLNVADNRNLDWFTGGLSRHVVFGRILEGFEVVEAISVVETEYDNPVEPIVMHKVTVDLGA